jgi:signal transduction histidine kinase
METQFASPERAAEKEIKSDVQYTKGLPLLKELTYLISDPFVILNQHRQIIYCNNTLLEILSIEEPEEIYGLRLGEALHCIHSTESEGGCGTTAFCRYCGAVNAIIKSQEDENSLKQEECRLVSGEENQAFDFMVRAKTLDLLDETFTLVVVRDIKNEKRREVLERIFFHDILNTAGGMQGLIELMKDATEEEMTEFLDLAGSSSDTLVEEINAQRDILAAENENLIIEMMVVNSHEILSSVISVYNNHRVARGKTIEVAEDTVLKDFLSDSRLLKRIVGNMTKNALEAETEGKTITISAKTIDNNIEFWVHNPSAMPDEAKKQIFQRSFSTKGSGRGLGTYSIKLLSEKFLKGKVSFKSEDKTGTIFSVELPIS